MDMTINQRLKKFILEKNITQEQLKVKIGLKARQQVSNWINCNDHIPDKHLVAILRAYPELNANWLIHEIGEVLNDQKSLKQINRNKYGFCEGCEEKKKEIEFLRNLIDKQTQEMKEICKEVGKLEERLAQYERELHIKPSSKKDKK